eukprot:1162002-Pelagomonas_calceolata.AAC.3
MPLISCTVEARPCWMAGRITQNAPNFADLQPRTEKHTHHSGPAQQTRDLVVWQNNTHPHLQSCSHAQRSALTTQALYSGNASLLDGRAVCTQRQLAGKLAEHRVASDGQVLLRSSTQGRTRVAAQRVTRDGQQLMRRSTESCTRVTAHVAALIAAQRLQHTLQHTGLPNRAGTAAHWYKLWHTGLRAGTFGQQHSVWHSRVNRALELSKRLLCEAHHTLGGLARVMLIAELR